MAHALGLKPGMVVADIGCGVGGPLMEIARFSGAKIVGVNSNAYQLERARKLTREAKLSDLADFIHCDFLSVEAPDESFDAAYSIEASCCAPDKVSIYSEIYRLLKPGACFGAYEYCMTDRFDARMPTTSRSRLTFSSVAACSSSTTTRPLMTRFEPWASMCWKRAI